LTTLGVATAGSVGKAMFGQVSVMSTDVLVMYTWAGDANLSGAIDGDDYFRIDAGFGAHATGYANGDFDYNGRIDADDYFIIDANYARQSGAFVAAPVSVTAVPEPGGVNCVVIAAAAVLRLSGRTSRRRV